MYSKSGLTELAERTLEQALAIHRDHGNRRHEAIALGHLAALFADSGRTAQAAMSWPQAIELDRAVGNKRFEGIHLCRYAALLRGLGRAAESRQAWARRAALLRRVGDLAELKRRMEVMRLVISGSVEVVVEQRTRKRR